MSPQRTVEPFAANELISLPTKLAALLIFIVAIFYNFSIYFVHDNDWILYMARQSFEGKKAYVDYYELNPPLIIWLNIPAVTLAKLTGVSLATALKIYIFSMITLVLLLTQKLIERCKPPAPQALFLALTFVLTILPAEQFGQREHFMLILLIPYIFLIAARAKKIKFTKSWVITSAVCAAIAICIKPYFVLIPAFCELYLLYLLGSQTFKRTEPYIMVVIGLTYLASIFILTPEYISVIIKHVRVVYQAGIGTTQQVMATTLVPSAMALAFALIANIYLKVKFRDVSPVYIVIFLVALANFVIFMVQFKGWPNHIYPLHALAITLVVILLMRLCVFYKRSPQLIIAVLGVSFILPLYGMSIYRIPMVKPYSNFTEYFEQRIKEFEENNPEDERNVESVLVISALIQTGFPLVNESGLDWGSRLPSMWMTPGIQKLKRSGNLSREVLESEAFSQTTVGQDLATRKPDLVFVHISKNKQFFGFPYDYIEDYSQNETFLAAWSAYEFVTSDNAFALYRRR